MTSYEFSNFSLWPQYVKQRIQDTYMYFGASIGVAAGSAVAIFRSPAMLNLVSRGGWIPLLVSIGAVSYYLIIDDNYC